LPLCNGFIMLALVDRRLNLFSGHAVTVSFRAFGDCVAEGASHLVLT
jgi:hypothetical protein